MLTYIASGAGFGFTAGTGFGPLHTILMNTTLSFGWRQGILIAFSPLASDLPIVTLMLFVLDQLPPVTIPMLQIGGALFIFYIAWQNWRQFRSRDNILAHSENPPEAMSRQTFLKGVTANLLNPAPYIFWGTVIGPLFITAAQESLLNAAALVLSFYAVFIGLMAFFVVLFDRLRTLDPRITRGLILMSVFILIFLGINLIVDGINSLNNFSA